MIIFFLGGGEKNALLKLSVSSKNRNFCFCFEPFKLLAFFNFFSCLEIRMIYERCFGIRCQSMDAMWQYEVLNMDVSQRQAIYSAQNSPTNIDKTPTVIH